MPTQISILRHDQVEINGGRVYLSKTNSGYTLHVLNKKEWGEARQRKEKDTIYNLGEIAKILNTDRVSGPESAEVIKRLNDASTKHNSNAKSWLKYLIIPWIFAKIFGWTCMTKYDFIKVPKASGTPITPENRVGEKSSDQSVPDGKRMRKENNEGEKTDANPVANAPKPENRIGENSNQSVPEGKNMKKENNEGEKVDVKPVANVQLNPAVTVHGNTVVFDPIFKNHITGEGHPERPERLDSIMGSLKQHAVNVISPRAATEEEILLGHSKDYYELVKREVAQGKSDLSTGDARISPESFKVAGFAVGAVLLAVDKVMKGEEKSIFCAVRPPGHHACPEKGMGFCLFNNAGIGARYAQSKHQIGKVLIVDWDVHHGNGTQDMFYSDPSVFYFSTHEKGNYPRTGEENETGEGAGVGTTLNCPIDRGSNSRFEVLKAFREKLLPAMEKFQPEFVIISAGFDAHEKDLLGHFNLKDEDYVEMTHIVKEIADKYAKGRIVSVLEGGYSLEALSTAVLAHVKALK